jgi:putative tryptophan/tyrosine transport system substrate-binding protein
VNRREFITPLASAAVTWPLAALAQEGGRIYRLGFVLPIGRQTPPVVAFFDELRLNGFIEGKNLATVAGSFGLEGNTPAGRATTVVKGAPDLIVAGGPLNTRAAQNAAPTLPIVALSDDMIGEGLTRSLAQPGGNTTGVSIFAPELDGKRQDFLIEAVPGASRMAALADSNVTTIRQLQALQEAVRSRGIELLAFTIARPEEITAAINDVKTAGAAAFNVLASPLLYGNRQAIIDRAAALHLPAMYQWPETAEDGGLMGYGPRITQMFRQVARLAVKVLRGSKTSDLPVEQPTRFELVINLQAAKVIGHEVPAGLVLRADKVID